jgi:hypothetical protein
MYLEMYLLACIPVSTTSRAARNISKPYLPYLESNFSLNHKIFDTIQFYI